MPLIGGRRRRTSTQDTGGGPPAWVVRWFLFGEPPERGTPDWRAYIQARFFAVAGSGDKMKQLFVEHHVALQKAWDVQGAPGTEPYWRGLYDLPESAA